MASPEHPADRPRERCCPTNDEADSTHPYLARGVLGDVIGLGILTVPLIHQRHRARHEALVCLGAIGGVHLGRLDWPLGLDDTTLTLTIVGAVIAYVLLRQRCLTASPRLDDQTHDVRDGLRAAPSPH